ncbi:histidine kinase [Rhizobium sp. AC44/96]|uniref:sensor histidine kinase n=1 Tax=unclassified Rhizobium TaxID=2613769 RepID=UPI00080FCE73|nr:MULTISPECIES: sensor histidine kinase [unclassified Rhizobium]MDM9621912.1 sensor histidine kinase [Rhizobium sp. S96]OCJ17328.1 histidine kinase [Rhizobium sp. AC44/96]
MPRLSRRPYSLATQFFVTGGVVSIVTMFVIGTILTHVIEAAVIRHTGATTALFVDSVVAPILPDMQTERVLDEGSAQALDEALMQGALGKRLVSFKLWRGDGTVLYSNDKNLVGRRFPVNEKLGQAFEGALVAHYEVAEDPESQEERRLGKPLMEIYNPVLQPWSGQPVAVLEFYETAEGLSDSLLSARVSTWASVAGLTAVFFLALSAIVFRGSNLIEKQRTELRSKISELSALLSENQALQRRLKRASQRAAELNERYLRSVGADLHDGPAQHIAYASMRLDSELLTHPRTSTETREKELSWIRSSLAEAMAEIRAICRGLVLPQIENASYSEILKRVVDAHATRTSSTVQVNVEDDGSSLAAAIKICVYRFTQEALNNAYRHGGGVRQSVTARLCEGMVHIEVRDQGEGFDQDTVRPTSIGLAGLRERIDSLGGVFEINTGHGGTTVSMSLQATDVEQL